MPRPVVPPGRLSRCKDSPKWRWRPTVVGRHLGLGTQTLGSDEEAARRRAAEIDAMAAAMLVATPYVLIPTRGDTVTHPIDRSDFFVVDRGGAGWSVRRGGEVLIAGATRLAALEVARRLADQGVPGVVEA